MILIPFLMGCPHAPGGPAAPVEVDPARLLARAQREAPPGPTSVTFGLSLDIGEQHIVAQGALLVTPPNRFRMEVRGPIGPAQVIIASDGVGLHAWLASKNTLYTVVDADARVRAITGDAGVDAVVSALLGRLPALGAPDGQPDPAVPSWHWSGAGRGGVDVQLSPRSGHLAAFTLVDPTGLPLLATRIEGDAWPTELVADLPSKQIHAELRFDTWRPASPPDTAYTLVLPSSVQVVPLEFLPE